MLFGAFAAPAPWKRVLIVAPLWVFLIATFATYLSLARFSKGISAEILWRCPACGRQLPRGTRRSHMIDAHGKKAGLPWILWRIFGVGLLIVFGGFALALSLLFFDLVSYQLFINSMLTLTIVLYMLIPFLAIGEVIWRKRLSRLRALWQTRRATDFKE